MNSYSAKRFRSLLAAHSCAGIDGATLSVCTEGFSWIIFKQALGHHALQSEMIEDDMSFKQWGTTDSAD